MSPPLPSELAPPDLSAHTFRLPQKEINTNGDVPTFISSAAYKLITAFINHLNASVSPLAATVLESREEEKQKNESAATFAKPPVSPERFVTDSPHITVSPQVQGIIDLVEELENYVKECPPAEGPRRFGNVAFRTWYKLVESKMNNGELFNKYLPKRILDISSPPGQPTARDELASYLLGSFGSAQRLDYGTGHELSFLAFLCGIFVLGGFESGKDEVAIALKVVDTYLRLIRTLVTTYNLEPAGSHGVWGLDDHSFIPYILGSAQLTTQPPVNGVMYERQEGIPHPVDVANPLVVQKERERNMYFGAIGFIYDVKKGPFWEHSPILYDISGIKEGWGKINIGMLKMYNAEVLGKFPVVQHFPFGSIFRWPDSDAQNLTTRLPWAKAGSLPPLEASPIPPPISKPRDPLLSSIVGGGGGFAVGVGATAAAARVPKVEERAPLKGPVDTKAPWASSTDARRSSSSTSSNPLNNTKAPWAR